MTTEAKNILRYNIVRDDNIDDFFFVSFTMFGETELQKHIDGASEKLSSKLTLENYQKWQMMIAERILLANLIGADISIIRNSERIMEFPIFSNEYKLKDLLDLKCSVGICPLANNGNGNPQTAQVWIFNGLKNYSSPKLDGLDCLDNSSQIIVSSKNIFKGESWQLAGKLAELALNDDKLCIELARNWIVTGCVDEKNRVNKVVLGNKLDIETKRKWLIPLECVKQISPDNSNRHIIRSCDNIAVAKNHIIGGGSKQHDSTEWPKDVEELHILVGGNIKAQIASALLTPCNKIVLWHSEDEENSKQPAKDILSVLSKLNIDTNVDMKELTSSSLLEAESSLKGHFNSKDSNNKIVFNVTSGNRLMSYAVQTLARLYPNIDLIYRDQGDKINHQFTLLNYREFPPYSGKIIGDSEYKVNFEFLYGNEKYDNVTNFIKKLQIGVQ